MGDPRPGPLSAPGMVPTAKPSQEPPPVGQRLENSCYGLLVAGPSSGSKSGSKFSLAGTFSERIQIRIEMWIEIFGGKSCKRDNPKVTLCI